MKQSAYQYSLYLLSGQDYSEFKLRQKLRHKEFEAEEIDQTIQKLVEKNYLREGEYKKLLVKKLLRKGKADSLIRRQIEQENLKIDAHELMVLREECGVSKEGTLSQLVAKKLRGQVVPVEREARQKLREKIARFLLSRGYSYDDVRRAVDTALLPHSTGTNSAE